MENRVRVRPLPDGSFRDGCEVLLRGKLLDIEFPDDCDITDLMPGIPVEVESSARVCLGVVQDRTGTGASILIEHLLQRSEIESIQAVWG